MHFPARPHIRMTSQSTKILSALVFLLFCLSIFYFFRPDLIFKLKNNYVSVSYERESRQVSYALVEKRPREWQPLHKISKEAAWAVVISEDWAFYQHSGVDLKQIKKAIGDHIQGDQRLRGASTISQQLIKNIFLSFERSLTRKMREAAMAVLMERVLTKEQILEHYLNVVEFGEGIYGISMASEYYFNKKASELNAKEGAFLAMLLPSPKSYAVSFEQKELTDYAKQTIGDILQKMNQAKMIDDQQLQRELARLLPFIKPQGAQKPKNTHKAATNPKNKRGFNDGRDFEQSYLNDPDLALAPVENFDPSKLEEIDMDVDVEFSLE